MKKIVLCGGGTGGHVFPAVAVGEILKIEDCDLFYIGVNGKAEEKIAQENGIEFYGYDFSGFPRKLQKEILIWPFNLLSAINKAKLYLKHFKPHLVFGTGGYSAAPVFIAAKRLKIPYIVHNLDFRLGLANKFCSNGAVLLTLGYPPDETQINNVNYVITGNPIRKSFYEIEQIDKLKLFKEMGLNPNKKVIFVAGGSQGANAVNEAILEILKDLVLNNNIQIIHQTGELAYEEFTKRIPAKVIETTSYIAKPFFKKPEICYHISDLVISRAGAMTVAEITILGKPAIFIPYPYAGNHQEANIIHLVNADAAVLLRQKGLKSKILLNTILDLISNNKKLNEMSMITRSFAKPNASKDIARLILETVEGKKTNLLRENLTGVI